MIRVLHILDSLDYGGIESFLVNIYRKIDREKIQFDFIIFKDDNCYEKEVLKYGGKIYKFNIDKKNKLIWMIKSIKAIKNTINNENYKIIHCHNCSLLGILKGTLAGRFCRGSKIIIAHSHNTGMPENNLLDKIERFFLKELIALSSDFYFACSKDAALSKFPRRKITDDSNNFKIIHNAIDINKFMFNNKCRISLREKLEIDDDFVIGHIGRFEYQKNHIFLIKVFNELVKRYSKSKLLLVGGGKLEETIKQEVTKLNLQDKVIFMGAQKNVEEYYQCMDVFVLPSIFEGLGIVLIEAQANGLKCIISNTIPHDAIITSNVITRDINNLNEWVDSLLQVKENLSRSNCLKEIKKNGYDLDNEAKELENIYEKIIHLDWK